MINGRDNILDIPVDDDVSRVALHAGQDRTIGMKQDASVFRWYHRVKNN